MESHLIGADPIPYRSEIALIFLLFAAITIAFMIFVAYKSTPKVMIGYRVHIFDSLVAAGLFSFTYSILYTAYIFTKPGSEKFYFISISLACLLDSAIPIKIVLLSFYFAGANSLRAIILCFKYRFEMVVYGKIKRLYLRYHKYFFYPTIAMPFPVMVFIICRTCAQGGFIGVLNITSPLVPSGKFSVEPITIQLELIDIILGGFVLYGAIMIFTFYTLFTYHLLFSNHKVVTQLSPGLLKAQRAAFMRLVCQALCTLLPGLLPSLLVYICYFNNSSVAFFAFNTLCWGPLMGFGFLYPFVVLLTMKPYSIYTKQLLLEKFCLKKKLPPAKIGSMTWVSPFNATNKYQRRNTQMFASHLEK